MPPIEDHPLRYQVANELHARPFPVLQAPSRAVFLALKPAQKAAERDRGADFDHLLDLLDRHGAPHPPAGATHYFGQIGKHQLKWESHTEFVTYTIFGDGVADTPFDARTYQMFPADWLDRAPGTRITSALIRVERQDGDDGIAEKLEKWFVPESLAVSRVIDDDAVIAGDFRIDEAGHQRFAVFVREATGRRRTGRIVQRLCEIETYKTMSMLGFARARTLGPTMSAIDKRLNALTDGLTGETNGVETTLHALLQVSGELEQLSAQSAFRFGATEAYEKIVNQRIQVLREARFHGRQTFAEFMMRRFDPAMRTVASTKARLDAMSARALRAADLLRTRVDVDRSRENKQLLESMDRRADLQLRLQRTVEGLSVVAISYYAVNLALYLLGPLGDGLDLDKGVQAALVTPPVLLGVWLLVRRIRKKMDH
ncbi:MAG: putative membrane-anchored protein conserved in bacteria [Rhodobacteraceae bacterium HLUCCA08]|nr:MAG: putative membrane-anchored protein conserved in bacteria [Rhodobacteraceae bacterium HLUCCA08]